MARKRSKKELRAIHAKKASDFGDNPNIRHSYGEHKQVSKEEPWEKRYRKRKSKW